MDKNFNVIQAFVFALDRCDFVAARKFLSKDCRYETGGGELIGPEAIIDSYERNAQWAARAIERVDYESEITRQSDSVFDVLYTDRISHRGHQHAYRCRQKLFLGPDGEIVRVLHEDIAGEPEALRAFFEAHGIRRSIVSAGESPKTE
jgi:hypothetical protein